MTAPTPDLPPLPEPEGYAAIAADGSHSIIVRPVDFAKHNGYAVFTAEQMREYIEADRAAGRALEAVPETLLTALRFYARGEHYVLEDEKFDTVSGEPQNWLHHEEECTMVENGTVAMLALHGRSVNWMDGDVDGTPAAIDNEVFRATPAASPAASPVPEIGMRDATYADSTPLLHVGSSAFEDWFQAQPFACTPGIKQISRDSYAAGMGDPLVTYAAASPVPAEPNDVFLALRPAAPTQETTK